MYWSVTQLTCATNNPPNSDKKERKEKNLRLIDSDFRKF